MTLSRAARALTGLACALGVAAATAAPSACEAQASTLDTARFHDNGDGTVTDKQSQLVWMRCASGQQWREAQCVGRPARVGWSEARRVVERINRAGDAFHDDWRLPALRELASITDRSCDMPRTNLAVFPQTPPAAFWTDTARPGEPAGGKVFVLSFGTEGVAPARKDERHHLRLVRTGP